jgi:hypothetical protein
MEKTCEADTKKIADSVSWAKFGPKSMAEFTWNLIVEEISIVEKISFNEVATFLRANATLLDTPGGDSAEGGVEDEIEFS